MRQVLGSTRSIFQHLEKFPSQLRSARSVCSLLQTRMEDSSLGVDPTKTPVVPAPAGQQSNFDNPASHANDYYIIAGICTALMTFLVFVRLYIRFLVTRTPWWDDCKALSTGIWDDLLILYSDCCACAGMNEKQQPFHSLQLTGVRLSSFNPHTLE